MSHTSLSFNNSFQRVISKELQTMHTHWFTHIHQRIQKVGEQHLMNPEKVHGRSDHSKGIHSKHTGIIILVVDNSFNYFKRNKIQVPNGYNFRALSHRYN